MPQVPSLEGPRVAPQGGTPYVSSPTVENRTGDQLQQAGRAIEGVGAQGAQIFEQRMREVNQLRIDEAISAAKAKANDLTFDEETGWAFQRGRDALDRESGVTLSEEYGTTYDEELDGISEGLSNDAQRAAFARARINLSDAFRGQINKHEAKEYEVWATSVKQGVISAAQRDIALYYDDPDRTARNIDTIRGAMYDLAKFKGTDRGEHLETAIREVISDSHMLAVSQMLENGNWTAAQTYVDKNKDALTEDALFKVDVAIGREEDMAVASEAASDYIAELVGGERAGGAEDFIMPVTGAIVGNNFGQARKNEKGEAYSHGGIDIPRPAGTPVSATAGGVITRIERSKTYGNVVYISHDDGKTETRYAHMEGFADGLKKGDRVQRGQVVGRVGSTGRSTGPHLHYEVRVDGKPVDPTKRYSVQRGSSASLTDILLRMREDPRLRGQPERLAAAEQQVRGIYAARKADQAEAQESARDAAYTALLQNGGDFTKIPAGVRGAINGSDLPGILSFGNSVQSALRGPPPQSGSALWAYAKSDIAEGKVSSMADLVKMRPYLSDSDFKDLVGDLQKVTSGETSKIDSVKTAYDAVKYIKSELAAIGIDTTPTDKAAAEEYGKFQAALYQQIAVAEREKGKPLTASEARQIGLSLIAETSQSDGGFWGTGLFADKKRGYQLDKGTLPYSAIPYDAKQNIARDLRAAGLPVTEDNIRRVYADRTHR